MRILAEFFELIQAVFLLGSIGVVIYTGVYIFLRSEAAFRSYLN